MTVHLRRITVVGVMLVVAVVTAPAAYADSAPAASTDHRAGSNWGDILYPDNPKWREQVEEKIISIKSQLGTMRDNTNAAVEIANNILEFQDIWTKIPLGKAPANG